MYFCGLLKIRAFKLPLYGTIKREKNVDMFDLMSPKVGYKQAWVRNRIRLAS
jgi:hypothetical protein